MMISEETCDTGDRSNDAENSALPLQEYFLFFIFFYRKIENNLTNVKHMRHQKSYLILINLKIVVSL